MLLVRAIRHHDASHRDEWSVTELLGGSLRLTWVVVRVGVQQASESREALAEEKVFNQFPLQPGFRETSSGLQFLDVRLGEGAPSKVGGKVVCDWAGYTIHLGRIIEAKRLTKGGAFSGDDNDLLRCVVSLSLTHLGFGVARNPNSTSHPPWASETTLQPARLDRRTGLLRSNLAYPKISLPGASLAGR